jgi:hypothetical protein
MNTFLIYLDIHNILYSLVLVYQVYFAFLRMITVHQNHDYSTTESWLQYTRIMINVHQNCDYSTTESWLQYTIIMITVHQNCDTVKDCKTY